jgi:hypothetical protein
VVRNPTPAARGRFRLPHAGFAAAALLWLAVPVADAQFGGGKSDFAAQFDRNGDGWLNADERAAARAAINGGQPALGRATGRVAPKTATVTPDSVRTYRDEPLYAPAVLRTLFLDFAEADWEQELTDFYRTDIDVPAMLRVDGRTYRDVGVHFRGQTSFMMVPGGYKHSMDIDLDLVGKQSLLGYRKLELLNAAADPTLLRNALYMHVMRQYLPAPQVNYMKVVINGEYWGVYVSEEHLTREFTQRAVGTADSLRWKIPGSPRGRGGLEYLGDDPAAYHGIYEIKSADKQASWQALINLCRVLNQTPPAQLQAALAPLLDIEGTLRFLAVEKALINNDGYWTRASDYSLFTDAQGRFHVAPHDANETLRPREQMGWGRFGQAPTSADPVELDALEGAQEPRKALLYRLLAVPALRARYLAYVREVADRWLDWKQLGPLAHSYQSVIAADIATDRHKLYSTEAFTRSVADDDLIEGQGGPIAPPTMSLKTFAEQRRAYLLRVIPPPAAH